MTFYEAVDYANECGWYIHQLWQEGTAWGCVLREAEGGARREICQGIGPNAAEAIYEALSAMPEIEVTVGAISESRPELLAIVGVKPITVTRRR